MKDSSYARRRNRKGAAICAIALLLWPLFGALLTQARRFASFRSVDWWTFYAFLFAEVVTAVFLVFFLMRTLRFSRSVWAERTARLTGEYTVESFDRKTADAVYRCFCLVGKKDALDAVYVVRRIETEKTSVSVFYLLFGTDTSVQKRQKVMDRVSRRFKIFPQLRFLLCDAELCEEFSEISEMEGTLIWCRAAVL